MSQTSPKRSYDLSLTVKLAIKSQPHAINELLGYESIICKPSQTFRRLCELSKVQVYRYPTFRKPHHSVSADCLVVGFSKFRSKVWIISNISPQKFTCVPTLNDVTCFLSVWPGWAKAENSGCMIQWLQLIWSRVIWRYCSSGWKQKQGWEP